jgi:hypothetical protein
MESERSIVWFRLGIPGILVRRGTGDTHAAPQQC